MPIIDKMSCVGCGQCVDACPYEAIWIESDEQIVVKCDLCKGDSSCAKVCPTEHFLKPGVERNESKSRVLWLDLDWET